MCIPIFFIIFYMKQNFESNMVMYSSGGWVILKGIFNEIISNIWNMRKWEMYIVSEYCRRGRRKGWSNKIKILKRVWFSQLSSLLILYPNFFFLTCSFLGLSCLFLPIISLNGQNWDPPTSTSLILDYNHVPHAWSHRSASLSSLLLSIFIFFS